MDAVRLIAESVRALAAARDETRIVAECWQAQTLARAVGAGLALSGPPGVRGDALSLSEAGGREGALPPASAGGGGIRAARLTGVADPCTALHALDRLLEQTGAALVAVATTAREDGAYWQCMEAIDATDDAHGRVRHILSRLGALDESVRDRGRWGPGEPPTSEEVGSVPEGGRSVPEEVRGAGREPGADPGRPTPGPTAGRT